MVQTGVIWEGPRQDVSILALEAWHVISPRTRNCLGHLDMPGDPTSSVAGVPIERMHLSDLSRCEGSSVFRVPNLGHVSYCEIAAAMDRYGWRFRKRWSGKAEPSALELLGPSLPRLLQKIIRAARTRSDRFAVGEAMLRLHEVEGLSGPEIGTRFGMSGAAVHATIQKTRRTLELRARFPLPLPPAAS